MKSKSRSCIVKKLSYKVINRIVGTHFVHNTLKYTAVYYPKKTVNRDDIISYNNKKSYNFLVKYGICIYIHIYSIYVVFLDYYIILLLWFIYREFYWRYTYKYIHKWRLIIQNPTIELGIQKHKEALPKYDWNVKSNLKLIS